LAKIALARFCITPFSIVAIGFPGGSLTFFLRHAGDPIDDHIVIEAGQFIGDKDHALVPVDEKARDSPNLEPSWAGVNDYRASQRG
jgi:hypothetical protein